MASSEQQMEEVENGEQTPDTVFDLVDEKQAAADEESSGKDFSEWTELMGNDLVMKTLETSSTDDSTAIQPQDAVIIDFVGRFAATKDDEDGPVFHEGRDWLIVVAERDVVPALEMGVRFMSLGDRAVIWSHSKFAYGMAGRRNGDYMLPPSSNVRYEVTVKSIVPNEERDTPSFQITASKAKKDIGNDVYRNEWADGQGKQRAIQLYKRGANTVEYLVQTSEDDDETIRNEARDVMLDCLNNIVAVYMRAKEYHKAKEAAIKVLTYDPDNFKALFRAAKAALLDPASSYEEAEAAVMKAAEKGDANDPDLQKLRIDLKRRKQEYKKKSKEMFSKIGKAENPPKEETKSDQEDKTKSHSAEQQKYSKDSDTQAAFDWKPIIKSSATQLLLTFIVYFISLLLKKRIEQGDAESTGAANEL